MSLPISLWIMEAWSMDLEGLRPGCTFGATRERHICHFVKAPQNNICHLKIISATVEVTTVKAGRWSQDTTGSAVLVLLAWCDQA